MILGSFRMLWDFPQIRLLDPQSLEKNPFVCIDTQSVQPHPRKDTDIHPYYSKSGILDSKNIRGLSGELLWNKKFKQWRIPNHGNLSSYDERKDGLVEKQYVKKGFCDDNLVFSGHFSLYGLKIPLLNGMRVDQETIPYFTSGYVNHFSGYNLPTHLFPQGSRVFSIAYQEHIYLFYFYFSEKEPGDSALLNSSLAYIHYPTLSPNINYSTQGDFFALYNQGSYFLKYGIFGRIDQNKKFHTYPSSQDSQIPYDFWDYFQILPFYSEIAPALFF